MKRVGVEEKVQEWLKANVIDEEIALNIQSYEQTRIVKQNRTNIVPILAGFLISLGILSFVASNWMTYNNGIKIAILLTILMGTYGVSDYFYQKDWKALSRGVRLIGLMSFGASIALIGQMFHVQAYNGFLFLIWGIISFCLYLYERHELFVLTTMIIFTVGLVSYELSQDVIQWFLFLSAVGGASYFYKELYQKWNVTFLYIVYMYLMLTVYLPTANWFSVYVANDWPYIVVAVFYLLASLGNSGAWEKIRRCVVVIAYFLMYIYAIFGSEFYYYEGINVYKQEMTILVSILFLATILMRVTRFLRYQEKYHFYELLVFIPIFLLTDPYGNQQYSFVSLGVLLFFSLCYMYLSVRNRQRKSYQLGIFSFVFLALSMYFQLTYSFMYKSLFFVIAGIILFLTYFMLRKIGKGWDHET